MLELIGLVAGLLIGFAEVMLSTYTVLPIPKDAVAFVVLIIVLLSYCVRMCGQIHINRRLQLLWCQILSETISSFLSHVLFLSFSCFCLFFQTDLM